MESPSIAILGIPIHNLTTDEAVEECLVLIDSCKGRPTHYVSTINLDFISNAFGWGGCKPKNPELLKVYRDSSLATADGMPIVWISKLLGSPLKQRVTGRELLPKLTHAMGKKENAVFLFGGVENLSKAAAIYLHDHSPGLRVVGIATPPVNIEGEELVRAFERDALIAEQINETKPELLVINLGNPKQEIWYDRIRPRLRVPLAIGLGGTLNVLGGKLSAAPEWLKKSGFEWAHRLFQEPFKLFFRYLKDFFHGASLIIPLVFYHTLNRLCFKIFHHPKEEIKYQTKNLLFLSQRNSLGVIQLPALIDFHALESLRLALEESGNQDTLILDFKHVGHIQPEGFSALIKLWQKSFRTKKELYFVNASRDIQWLMFFHRTWDIFGGISCESIDELVYLLNRKGNWLSFYDSIEQNDEDSVTIHFFGPLNNTQDFTLYLQKLIPLISQKNCTLDFSYCTDIDNTGLCFLMNLRKQILDDGKCLFLKSVNRFVMKQLQAGKIDNFFKLNKK